MSHKDNIMITNILGENYMRHTKIDKQAIVMEIQGIRIAAFVIGMDNFHVVIHPDHIKHIALADKMEDDSQSIEIPLADPDLVKKVHDILPVLVEYCRGWIDG